VSLERKRETRTTGKEYILGVKLILLYFSAVRISSLSTLAGYLGKLHTPDRSLCISEFRPPVMCGCASCDFPPGPQLFD